MPDSEANEPSKADHEQRIAQLEATVQKMMPTRRGVLTGLAGAGIGGAAVYGASENARAQAAGLQGTEAEPNDMWAWNLNVANQVTSDLAMGGNDVTGVGAVDVGSLSDGVAGSGNSITSLWGNSGEYVLVASRAYPGQFTFSTTAYDTVNNTNNRFYAFHDGDLRTNWETYGFSWTGRLQCDTDGQSASVRLRDVASPTGDLADTEETVADNATLHVHGSNIHDRNVDPMRIDIEGQVSDGAVTGTLDRVIVFQWGKIA